MESVDKDREKKDKRNAYRRTEEYKAPLSWQLKPNSYT